MKKIFVIASMIIAIISGNFEAKGQDGVDNKRFAIKTNFLYDASATINAGVEFSLSPSWSFDLSGNWNSWSTSGKSRWKHWLVQPEARYWFCDVLANHFVGFHLLGQQFNFGGIDADFKFLGTDFSKLKDHRYQGYSVGAGLAYGYAFVLGQHWNLELELGAGYVYSWYDEYDCTECATKTGKDLDHHYVGPTKLAVNLVYLF
jgi:hypothetical protein